MNLTFADFFQNPALNPVFIHIAWLTVVGFFLGFLLILVLNDFSYKDIWKSKVGEIYRGWVILIPLYVLGISFGWLTGSIVLFFFMVLACREIARIASLPEEYEYTLTVLSFLTVFVVWAYPTVFAILPFIYFAAIAFTTVRKNDADHGFYNATVALYAAIWVIFGLGHVGQLAHINGTIDQTSALLFMLVFAVTLSDIGAYVFGKFFEKIGFATEYTIASNLNPRKTYGGVIGHIVGAGLGVLVMWFAVSEYLPLYHWVILIVLIGVAGSVGGMVNSTFKRFYKTKDSGNLLAGHGGAIDRIDSTIMVVVVLVYYFALFS